MNSPSSKWRVAREIAASRVMRLFLEDIGVDDVRLVIACHPSNWHRKCSDESMATQHESSMKSTRLATAVPRYKRGDRVHTPAHGVCEIESMVGGSRRARPSRERAY